MSTSGIHAGLASLTFLSPSRDGARVLQAVCAFHADHHLGMARCALADATHLSEAAIDRALASLRDEGRIHEASGYLWPGGR